MSQQELPVVSALEFDQVRSSIKDYIKTKTDFTDYDFEGSNMSMLVDILSYNTLYTTYNVNMASNELNLDTAVLRDNVVSIAKRLGYKAGSYTSSKIKIDLEVTGVSSYAAVRVAPGTVLSASNDKKSFTFLLRNQLEILPRGQNTVKFSDVEVIEGSEFAITYTVDESNEHQRFFVPNSFIDAETIRVYVISDPSNTKEVEYTRSKTIAGVSNSDTVFFVEEVQDQKYEIVFGDDVIGRRVKNGEVVKIQYVITNGSLANAIDNFTMIGKIKGVASGGSEVIIPFQQINHTLKDTQSTGGSEFESIRDIKYRAPRAFASQERAVTVSDYEVLVAQIYENLDLVSVVGGEDVVPPQFGKVLITIKPSVGEAVSASEKARIKNELRKYKVGSVEVVILDYISMNVVIKPYITYDANRTKNREFELIALLSALVKAYAESLGFDKFGGIYSDLDLRCKIKDLDDAIQFVNVPLYLEQKVCLDSTLEKEYTVDFHTKLRKETDDAYFVLSEPFVVEGVNTAVYLGAKSGCTSDGKLYLYTIGGTEIAAVGTVDIDTGRLKFTLKALQDMCINILVIPEIIDIVFGPNVVPNLVLADPVISDNLDDLLEMLDEDQTILDIDTYLDTDLTGDPDASTSTVTTGVGGSTVTTPTITGDQVTKATDTDPVISDPNDIDTIDDYTPETNPYSCS
jgi:hypothetical protein